MADGILKQLQFFEPLRVSQGENEENFENIYLLNDSKTKERVKSFLLEAYLNFLETITKIESALPFSSNSVDYKELKEIAERLKEFMKRYKEIFMAAGVAKEKEVNDKFTLWIEEKSAELNFLSH